MTTSIPVPLVYPLNNRDSTLDKDSKMLNTYVEKESDEIIRVIKRDGIDAGTLYEAGTAQGIVNYLGVIRVFVNNKFYKSPGVFVSVDTNGEQVDFS